MDSPAMSQRRKRFEEARRAEGPPWSLLARRDGTRRVCDGLRWIALAGRSGRCEAGAPIGSQWEGVSKWWEVGSAAT